MPEYRRAFQPGGTFFLTLVTHYRYPLFAMDSARNLLRTSISLTRRERPFELVALVLLPDHLHLIITLPDHDGDFSIRVAAIKGRFTRKWLAMGGSEADQSASRHKHAYRGIWQKRFWEHCVRDEQDLMRCTEYIFYNPVKHGLAKCPHEWPHSSFGKYASSGQIDLNWQCTCERIPEPFAIEIAGAEMD